MSSNRLIYFESPHRNFGSTVEIRYSFITELSGIPSLILLTVDHCPYSQRASGQVPKQISFKILLRISGQ